MATILINSLSKENKTIEVKGKVTAKHSAMLDDKDNWVDGGVTGVLLTHSYIPNIEDIVCDRYTITGINVISENFGSDDFNIRYEFVAENIEVSNNDILSSSEVKTIEDRVYAYEKNESRYLYGVNPEEDYDE